MYRLAFASMVLLLVSGAARAEGWLAYDRSGGITGWSLKLTVDETGVVRVAGDRQPAELVRQPLSSEELGQLRGLVARALSVPAGRRAGEGGRIADGMQRVLTVNDGELGRVLLLSDGLSLTATDRELIASLEALASRPIAPAGPRPEPVKLEENARRSEEAELGPPRLERVVVAPAAGEAGEETAILLELPVGRADEPAGRSGAIELLLSIALGPHESVLLDGAPPVADPDTGAWSLSVTPTRTRLLVVLPDPTPAAARGAIAAFRTVLNLPLVALRAPSADDLDHHRRRLAAAQSAWSAEPRGRRTAALRAAAWGPSLGAAPEPFGIHAIEREDLLAMARLVRRGHSRLIVAGAVARQAAAPLTRGFDLAEREPLLAPTARPAAGTRSTRNEALAAAPVDALASGPAAALALGIAQRRLGGTWVERLEPGDARLPVAGDTLALVAPAGGLEMEEAVARLRLNLSQLSTGLQQSAVDARSRRRALGGAERRQPAGRVRDAADLLELGALRPPGAELDLAAARAGLPALGAEEVRAAAGALARSLTALRPWAPPRPADDEAAPLLESARRALFGELPEEAFPRLVLERRARDESGRAVALRLELGEQLLLRLEGPAGASELRAGVLTAGSSPAALREQELVREALADPALLVAGAAAGLFPVRSAAGELLESEGGARRCLGLEVLVPARGSYRLSLDPGTGDVLAVERRDPLGRTLRVLMSDIRVDGSGRRIARKQELLEADGARRSLLEEVSLHVEPR